MISHRFRLLIIERRTGISGSEARRQLLSVKGNHGSLLWQEHNTTAR